jgi:hypothetical protein
MFDDRRRDHVALRVGERLLLPADLQTQREAHVVAQFLSDGRCPEHGAIENEAGTKSYHSKRFQVGNQTGR